MTIAPIVRSVKVRATPAHAFELFTARFGDWWPKDQTPAKKRAVALFLEPGVGGRWYERDGDGGESQWGEVLVWAPPSRLVIGWRLNNAWAYDPTFLTEVEITFEPAGEGWTTETLEHRNLERFGDDALSRAESLGGGWAKHLATFTQFVDANPET
jgi:uncharacterized protein YndB with AHSA1/START domain